jgi:hypothetical protein
MSNTTNVASTCESLFNDVEDLGSGVAAIGQLLRFGQHEAYPDVLNGIGVVLHHLGKTMSGLNAQFMDGGVYRNIHELEKKEAEALLAQQNQNEKEKNIEALKLLLSTADEQVPIESKISSVSA